MTIDNYLIDNMGEFECTLRENENSKNKKKETLNIMFKLKIHSKENIFNWKVW
jgi:hypothetical protein